MNLKERMVGYERSNQTHLMRRTPVIIRIDGKAFHTFTKGLCKPFDKVLHDTMIETMRYLCKNVENCVFGYTQSDEISLLLVDYKNTDTCAWFNNNVQKLVSISASMATAIFNKIWLEKMDEDYFEKTSPVYRELRMLYKRKTNTAMFDSRAFTVPTHEVVNYFIYRQQDATRNSIQALGQANFSHKELSGKSSKEIQDMLMTNKGINWDKLSIPLKRGISCVKVPVEVKSISAEGNTVIRDKWEVDYDTPIFTAHKEYIEKFI